MEKENNNWLKFEKLMTVLAYFKDQNMLDNVSIYVGEINGVYNIDMKDSKQPLYDSVLTNGNLGNVLNTTLSDTNIGYSVTEADYVAVLTEYKENDDGKSRYTHVDVFLNTSSVNDFFAFCKEGHYIFFPRVCFSGFVKNYQGNSLGKEWSVSPSSNLIDINKNISSKHSKRRFR